MSEAIKPMKTVAASGGIPGPKMNTAKLMETTDFSRHPVGKVPKGSPLKLTKEPKMAGRR
jgi:hypothetical protein